MVNGRNLQTIHIMPTMWPSGPTAQQGALGNGCKNGVVCCEQTVSRVHTSTQYIYCTGMVDLSTPKIMVDLNSRDQLWDQSKWSQVRGGPSFDVEREQSDTVEVFLGLGNSGPITEVVSLLRWSYY